MRWMLRSKIHRATVTSVHLDYEGSITIDKELIDKSGLWIGEKVTIANVDNGNRFDTYIIPGISGSGIISINGAAAHLCGVGDKVIIMGFELVERPIQSKVVLVDENNVISKELVL